MPLFAVTVESRYGGPGKPELVEAAARPALKDLIDRFADWSKSFDNPKPKTRSGADASFYSEGAIFTASWDQDDLELAVYEVTPIQM